jgi:hypothetical protein
MGSPAIVPDGPPAYCAKCGTQVSALAMYCRSCGAPIPLRGTTPDIERNLPPGSALKPKQGPPSVALFVIAGATALIGWVLLANKAQIALSAFGCGQAFGPVCFAPSQLGLAVIELFGMVLMITAVITGVIGAVKYRTR